MSAVEFPRRAHVLLVTVDSVIVDTQPVSSYVAEDADLVMETLITWSKSLKHKFQQVEQLEDNLFQLDFATAEGQAATALAAVFTATRH